MANKIIQKELEKRFHQNKNAKSPNEYAYIHITLKKSGKVVEIAEDVNFWTKQKYFTLTYIDLDINGYVVSAEYINSYNTLKEVAEWINAQ